MIGILCPTQKKRKYVNDFSRFLGKFTSKYNIPACLFSVSDIDFETLTVQGTYFEGEKVLNETITLPKLIFNISEEFLKQEIHLKRELLEINDLIIINETNEFDQLMIKEMLDSSAKTKGYLKPDLNSSKKVSMMLFKSKVIRFYIQKIGEQGWKINFYQKIVFYQNSNEILIYRAKQQKGDYLSEQEEISLHQSVMDIINYVEKFIPSLGFCYIDMAIDQQRRPYFMGLGGWNQRLITNLKNNQIVDQLLDNLFSHANYLLNNARR